MVEKYHYDEFQLSSHLITDTKLEKMVLQKVIIMPQSMRSTTWRIREQLRDTTEPFNRLYMLTVSKFSASHKYHCHC